MQEYLDAIICSSYKWPTLDFQSMANECHTCTVDDPQQLVPNAQFKEARKTNKRFKNSLGPDPAIMTCSNPACGKNFKSKELFTETLVRAWNDSHLEGR
jgi:hypothetical protein